MAEIPSSYHKIACQLLTMVILSTHNLCFGKKIRKLKFDYALTCIDLEACSVLFIV